MTPAGEGHRLSKNALVSWVLAVAIALSMPLSASQLCIASILTQGAASDCEQVCARAQCPMHQQAIASGNDRACHLANAAGSTGGHERFVTIIGSLPPRPFRAAHDDRPRATPAVSVAWRSCYRLIEPPPPRTV